MAIPIKKKVSKTNLQKILTKKIKSMFTYRIVSDSQLKNLVVNQVPCVRRKKQCKKKLRGKRK